ncbi:MAG TPA: glycosyltransferase family 4 protein [Actinomycetes bacterium]|nr:glycosyltransferase family 4 protein [Actinomycetes bacterium]
MKVGLVCPFDWDVPGGVSIHVRDLADELITLGHDVAVLAPGEDAEAAPDYVTLAGRTMPVPHNGSVARVQFGPVSASRTRRWIREGEFDVLHVHSPISPSLSMLACWAAIGPVVATFHTSLDGHSRVMSAGFGLLRATLETVRGRIAVSEMARRTVVQHLGGDAVLIPNGVRVSSFAGAEPLPGWPGAGGSLVFLGRIDETRKGLGVLLEAFPSVAAALPGVRLLVVGPGDPSDAIDALPPGLRDRVTFLGRVSDADKARALASADIYVAPHIGGESFGIVLLEAMAAGTAVLASDLVAFRQVLDGGHTGRLVPVGDATRLADAAIELLRSPKQRAELADAGQVRAAEYDWSVVTQQILAVYDTVRGPGEKVLEDDRQGPGVFAGRRRGAK